MKNNSNCGAENAEKGNCPWWRFDFSVLAFIVVLAVILGALNNLRVADERRVKWFDAPADRSGLETTEAEAADLPTAVDNAEEKVAARRSAPIGISTGAIRPGEWNADFKGVLAKAESERRPMVVLCTRKGCGYCTRLEESIAGSVFRLWREDRAPLMAFVKAGSRLSSSETLNAYNAFIKGSNKGLTVPLVCVYWPQNGVTNKVAFSGRRGMMGGLRNKSLVVEMMSALDRALGVQAKDGHKSLESILELADADRISVRADDGGTASMTPEDGKFVDGEKVELVAKPDAGYVFLDWLRPDGSSVAFEPRLTVSEDMATGCYTARFKPLSQCKPPLLVSPAEVAVRIKVKERFSHEILVDESCRPVRFLIKKPVAGVSVDPSTGVVTGSFPQATTNAVEISVIGNDSGQTEKTVRLLVEVSQKKPLLRRQ